MQRVPGTRQSVTTIIVSVLRAPRKSHPPKCCPAKHSTPRTPIETAPPLCTEYFHTQMDTPRPGPGGYGRCAPPACNCGSKPCGFYVFNHSSDVIVHNQTFQEWFIDSYILDSIGMSPSVSGFFFDVRLQRSISYSSIPLEPPPCVTCNIQPPLTPSLYFRRRISGVRRGIWETTHQTLFKTWALPQRTSFS